MAKSEMVKSEETKTRMVKIKTIRDVQVSGKIVPPNTEVEVTEAEAAALCDKEFAGPYLGAGDGDFKLAKLVRAVRV